MPTDPKYDPNTGDYIIANGSPELTTASDAKAGRCLAVRHGEWVSADSPDDVFGNRRWKQTERGSDTPELRNEAKRLDVESLSPLVSGGLLAPIDETEDAAVVDLPGGGFGVRIEATDQTAVGAEPILLLEAYGRQEAE